MTARYLRRPAATTMLVVLACACSEVDGGVGHTPGDTRSFVPEGLPNDELGGQAGGLTLSAFTLVQGENGLDLFAAARNEGTTPLCEAGMTLDFVDGSGQLLGSAGIALHSGAFYRMAGGSDVVLSCVAPGGVAMGGVFGIFGPATLDQIAQVAHAFPSFVLPAIVPVDGLSVSDVSAIAKGGGTAYTGSLHNALATAVNDGRVSVFPVNRAGRPLGMATSELGLSLSPAGSVLFETTIVGERGDGHVALAAIAR